VFAGAHNYQFKPSECSRGHEVQVEAIRVLIKAVRVPIEIVGEPKEAVRVPYTTLSWPLQHSHSREKFIVKCQFQAKRGRGLESVLEAVRVSVEAVRVMIEALRCFRGHESVSRGHESDDRGLEMFDRGRESVAEVKKVPVEVVREPVRKTVLKKFWKTSKRFVFVPKFFGLNVKIPHLF
jgi:hypothetical protein